MKIRYLKLRHWLLAALAGLLGLPIACDNLDNDIVAMYACPSATYHVNGTVTNAKGEPLAGISIGDEDTTGADGRYKIDLQDAFPGETQTLSFRDIDGSEHGSYNDTIVEINTENVQLTGGDGGWNHGEGTITQNVTMTEKTNK